MQSSYQPYKVPVSVKGIVFEGQKVWLRKNERNEWELPGGKMDEGEQPDEAVTRELKEELGFITEAVDLVDSYLYVIKVSEDENRGVLVVSYLCNLIAKTGDFELIGEAGQAKFELFDIEELDKISIPDFYRKAIRKAFKLYANKSIEI